MRVRSHTTSVAPSRTSIVERGLIALALAVLANALIRGIAVALVSGAESVDPLGWGPVLVSTAVAATMATGVYAALVRFTGRPTRNFVALAAVVLVASLIPIATVAPSIPGVTTPVLGALVAMHVASAVAIVAALTGAVNRRTVGLRARSGAKPR
ncbi:DUF6069 family protein [Halegenticoccus soli]|uniref:DUF6069 family protein n=1 Tax=Halegenticoccus soli TaxID=1985678 RepID=UPI000C6E4870|nr:DUF6069 family protein [Halegenticoccus soli]